MRSEDPAVTAVLDGLRRIVQVLRESSRSSERTLGVTGAQLFALKALAEAPRSSLNELAARTHTHQSTVSVVVQRLVAAGLVRRVTSDADGRRLELSVTAKGRTVLGRAPLAAQERLVAGLRALTARRRSSLARDVTELVEAMGVSSGDAPMFFEDAPRTRARRRGAA